MPENSTDSPTGATEDLGMSLPTITSETSTGEPSSTNEAPIFDEAQLGRLANALTEMIAPKIRETLRPDIEKGIQATKDRRFKKLEGLDPEDVSLVADALKQADGDPIKAAVNLGIQGLLEERRLGGSLKPTAATQAAPVSTSVGDATDEERKERVRKILSNSGLPEEGMKTVLEQWGKKSFASEEDSLAALTTMAIKQVANPQTGPASGTPIPTGSTAIGSVDNEKVLVDLYNELGELNREPSKNAARIAEVKEALRAQGESNIV